MGCGEASRDFDRAGVPGPHEAVRPSRVGLSTCGIFVVVPACVEMAREGGTRKDAESRGLSAVSLGSLTVQRVMHAGPSLRQQRLSSPAPSPASGPSQGRARFLLAMSRRQRPVRRLASLRAARRRRGRHVPPARPPTCTAEVGRPDRDTLPKAMANPAPTADGLGAGELVNDAPCDGGVTDP